MCYEMKQWKQFSLNENHTQNTQIIFLFSPNVQSSIQLFFGSFIHSFIYFISLTFWYLYGFLVKIENCDWFFCLYYVVYMRRSSNLYLTKKTFQKLQKSNGTCFCPLNIYFIKIVCGTVCRLFVQHSKHNANFYCNFGKW